MCEYGAAFVARSLLRGREIAIRAALGASRRRLIRQFLSEGLVLAGCGGLAGILLSRWMVLLLVAVLPKRSPLLASAHLDARAIGFTLAISLISTLVFAMGSGGQGQPVDTGAVA